MVIVCKLLQPSNAFLLIAVTVAGIVTLDSFLQNWNVLSSIVDTPVGIVTLVKFSQPLNA